MHVTSQTSAGGVAEQLFMLAERRIRAVPEWRATLDARPGAGLASGPAGFRGVSLGSATGIALVAAEPRISAAVYGLAPFDAFASPRKTPHANPGRRTAIPAFELAASELFFRRHLLAP